MMLTYIREKTEGAVLPAMQGRPTKAAAQTRQTVSQREHQGTATFADTLSLPQAEIQTYQSLLHVFSTKDCTALIY